MIKHTNYITNFVHIIYGSSEFPFIFIVRCMRRCCWRQTVQNGMTAGTKFINLGGHGSVVIMFCVLQVQLALFCIVQAECIAFWCMKSINGLDSFLSSQWSFCCFSHSLSWYSISFCCAISCIVSLRQYTPFATRKPLVSCLPELHSSCIHSPSSIIELLHISHLDTNVLKWANP